MIKLNSELSREFNFYLHKAQAYIQTELHDSLFGMDFKLHNYSAALNRKKQYINAYMTFKDEKQDDGYLDSLIYD